MSLDTHRGTAADLFTPAGLFFRSQSEIEKESIVQAFRFELSTVAGRAIRDRILAVLSQVDCTLARRVAEGLGISVPRGEVGLQIHPTGTFATDLD